MPREGRTFSTAGVVLKFALLVAALLAARYAMTETSSLGGPLGGLKAVDAGGVVNAAADALEWSRRASPEEVRDSEGNADLDTTTSTVSEPAGAFVDTDAAALLADVGGAVEAVDSNGDNGGASIHGDGGGGGETDSGGGEDAWATDGGRADSERDTARQDVASTDEVDMSSLATYGRTTTTTTEDDDAFANDVANFSGLEDKQDKTSAAPSPEIVPKERISNTPPTKSPLNLFVKHAGTQCLGTMKIYDFPGTAEECATSCLRNTLCTGFVRVNTGPHSRGNGACYLRGGPLKKPEKFTRDGRDCYVPTAAALMDGVRLDAKRREGHSEAHPRGGEAVKSKPMAPTSLAAKEEPAPIPVRGGAHPARGTLSSGVGGPATHEELMHVCFCWDDGSNNQPVNLMPLVVAINSTLANTPDGSRVVFHVVTTGAAATATMGLLAAQLPKARIQVHFDDTLEQHILSLVTFRKSSGARKNLASAFNFAPFYLDTFLGIKAEDREPGRLIYMDTDIVVVGDIRELHSLDLEGHALGAVEDCAQKFDMYIDFKALKEMGLLKDGISRQSCVFNRGVFMVDVGRWREMGLTSEIETYMAAYKSSRKDLYRFGVSQPPWLLAVRGRYKKLGTEWNCRGLGRELLSPKEHDILKKEGDNEFLLGMLKKSGTYFKPFVSTCSAQARILHFNGALKPWKRKKWKLDKKPSLCKQRSLATKKHVQAFVECASFWKKYISDASEAALSPAIQTS